ncbi:trimeric intracellular cation channel family protein [Anaeromyxobacter sp. PSR-1]|uniref:trimeric intracellular cation channel family protein n=1 Tax=unclassified Anaeromyxobacter TaxID=2620896 RepID=UPI0005DB923C|nr:TRIC cation channel family protein [Anaeromyxobacter sp. PSR-1]GAO05513.1 hypothetical protein PSR1_04427 [Anaeromyxobacter sp. PSR-1]
MPHAARFLENPFQLHITFDLAATYLFAVTGALAAISKRYDFVGVLVLAFVTGLGGALLRDGLFLQFGPPAVVTDGRYLVAVALGAATGVFFGKRLHRFQIPFLLADAVALGTYGVVGANKSIAAGLPMLTALLVGAVNAVGGGLLRDLLVHDVPLVFRPGEFYALAAMAGEVVFIGLTRGAGLPGTLSALIAIAAAFAVRILSVWLGWRTEALSGEDGTGER